VIRRIAALLALLVVALVTLPASASAMGHGHGTTAVAEPKTEATMTRHGHDDASIIEGMADWGALSAPAKSCGCGIGGHGAGDCSAGCAACSDLARLFAEALLPIADRTPQPAPGAADPATADFVPPLPPPRG
jgi:hypothetical protein